MSYRILDKMREKIRLCQYVMTTHAEEEMDEDNISIFDIENAILTGKIVKHQRDKRTKESKYLIKGQTRDGYTTLIVVSKFGITGKLIILTVYVEQI